MSNIDHDRIRRFSILEHRVGDRFRRLGTPPSGDAIAGGAIHWDWLFDVASWDSDTAPDAKQLITWATDPLHRSSTGLHSIPSGVYQAVRLPDHRRRYLDYEGDIGGGRGEVKQLATGLITSHDFTSQSTSEGDVVALTILVKKSIAFETGIHRTLRWYRKRAQMAEARHQSSEIASSGTAPPRWTLRLE